MSETLHHICSARLELEQPYLLALRRLPGGLPPAENSDLEPVVPCLLEEHPVHTPHFGIGRALPTPHSGEVWVTWRDGQQPHGLINLPDCDATDPSAGEGCVLFSDHPGLHSWHLTDTVILEALRKLL